MDKFFGDTLPTRAGAAGEQEQDISDVLAILANAAVGIIK
jgi:hypothetical protein